jgi:uncharacterized lipoprotein YddW (UPF0748 family)
MKFSKICFLTLVLSLLISGCIDEFKNKKEARGIWMSRFDYTRTKEKYDQEEIRQTILNSFQNARRAKFNMIIFQVRGNGDAFYRSDYEPWSQLLSGTLGKDPGWDPLQFAIETAHSLGLEIHIWLNTFPAWRANDPKPVESTPRHVLLEHPDWVVCDKNGKQMEPRDGYISISPGIPEVRQHITKVVMNIVRKYDIDGIHFDYIRYPEGSNTLGYSHDAISNARFKSNEGNSKNLDWENWQREQICDFVRNVYDSITAVKPWVRMSASVIGNYKKAGWNGYNIVFQDANTWMKESKIDFIVPMIYQRRDHPTAPFGGALEEWKTMLNMRNVYPGLGAYRATGANGWGWNEIWEEIKLARETGFPGIVFFAMSNMFSVFNEINQNQFPFWANAPSFNFKVKEKPETPKNIIVERISENKIIVKWDKVKNDSHEQTHYYNVYRSASKEFNFETADNLIFVTRMNENQFTDANVGSKDYYYCISALSRTNIEGERSEIVKSKAVSLSRR